MHSTLQAEVRFTRVLTAACRHCARNLPRPFHSARRLHGPQPPHNNDSSVAGRAVASDARESEHRIETTKESGSSYNNVAPNPSQTTQTASPENPPSAIEKPLSDFHGSPAKRRMRSRVSRAADLEYQPPEWFSEFNILLHHENQSPSDIELYINPQPFPPRKRADSIPSETNSVGKPATNDDSFSLKRPFNLDHMPKFPPRPRYSFHKAQYQEVSQTAKGLLKLPHDQLHRLPDADSLRNHLLLSFAAKNGDRFLDALVRDLARDLGCDLMALDAQDLVEVYKGSLEENEGATPERLLSYDIFTEAYGDQTVKARERPPPEEEQDEDEDDDFDTASIGSFGKLGGSDALGLPIMVGKPISINLKDLLDGPTGRAVWRDRSRSTGASMSKSKQGGSEGVVPGLFQCLDKRRSDSRRSPKAPTIVHIKDLRAIQETDLGSRFLGGLFQEVGKRRKSGQNIIIVGTDSARHDQMHLAKLHEIQNGGQSEISQNIVLTPGCRDLADMAIFDQDRKLRVRSINLRHLWEALKYRDPSILSQLKPGFWHLPGRQALLTFDHIHLERKLWSYAYVHRLAVTMAGAPEVTPQPPLPNGLRLDPLTPQDPILTAHRSFDGSDKTKARWFELERIRRDQRIQAKPTLEGKSGLQQSIKSSQAQVEGLEEENSMDDSRLRDLRSTVSKYEKKLMNGIIEAKNITTTFSDVHMPMETIDALNTLTTLSLTRPDAFKYGVLASDKIPGLLLYGPPGTGKTLAAKAVAKESGATMLEVSAADINDMYVGEGEKNVRALFSLARKLSPCVVFLDEADAIFSARGNQGRRANHREVLNQFLKEWDGMSNDSGSAFIMVATNRPMDLDDAVLRRLPRRLLVDLPTESDRLEILKIHLRNESLAEDLDLATIAKNTPFYSGSDLKNACVGAALNAVREENQAAKQHTGDLPFQYPERRTLTNKHFETALEDISASVSEDMNSLRDIKKFDEQYGDKRGKKKKNPRLGFPTSKPQRDTVKVRE